MIIQQLQTTSYIFEKNFEELDKLFRYIHQEENIFLLMTVENRPLFNQYMLELICKIHNFVSSVYTYIDHTRNFMSKNYKDTTFEINYNKKLEENIINNNLCIFVKEFRNYCIHFCIPNITFNFQGQFGESRHNFLSGRCIIYNNDLLNFNNWSKQSKNFLQNNKIINLEEIFTEYYKIISDFYNWFYSNIEK